MKGLNITEPATFHAIVKKKLCTILLIKREIFCFYEPEANKKRQVSIVVPYTLNKNEKHHQITLKAKMDRFN